MTTQEQVLKLLAEHMLDPGTQWSLGTFGGIAEFSRDPNETVELTTSGRQIAAVTDRGAVRIQLHEQLRPFASESITKQNWSHRVALCLPQDICAMNRRNVLTELGADAGSLREQDREAVLFDVGLNALQADLCIRTSDLDAIAELRNHTGRSVFEPGNPAMGVILATNPHRVFISRIGRLEVYQRIPPATGKSPDGPHTHILPKLLAHGRTHAATESLPEGWVPCAHLYPPHPLRDPFGKARSFRRDHHAAFQILLERYGDPELITFKRQVIDAVKTLSEPGSLSLAQNRLTRTALRIALRQLQAEQPSLGLKPWLDRHDRPGLADDEDPMEALH
jgi:hypothetical protein